MSKLRARLVVPITAPPIRNGCVEVRGDRIVAVHSRPPPGAVDLGDVALLPGLINAHTHLEFSDLERPLGPPGPFTAWLIAVIENRRGKLAGLDPAEAARRKAEVVRHGLRECAQSGTAVIGEITTSGWASLPNDADGPEIVAFHEVLGGIARAEQVLGDAARQVTQWKRRERIHPGFSPHAPYSIHPAIFRQIVRMAFSSKIPLAMHLAETRAERQLLTDGTGEFVNFLTSLGVWDPQALSPNTSLIGYLDQLALAPRGLVVHGNYLTDDEIECLQKHGHLSVVYCPRTHAYFQHTPHPWRQMLAKGIRVVLGTDSRASNPDLSVWREARFLSQRCPDISPETLLRMLTIDGATALGVEQDFGSIEPGKRARFAMVPLSRGESLDELFLADAMVLP